MNIDVHAHYVPSDSLKVAAEIGARLKAGTNCGSCIPEMKRLIAQTAMEQPPLAAVS